MPNILALYKYNIPKNWRCKYNLPKKLANINICMVNNMKEILNIIKNKRKELKLTQEDMANKLKIARTSYQAIELGNIKLTLEDFLNIIKILDIPITSFNKNKLLVISEDDLNKLKKATDLLNSVTNKLKYQEINISDNHGTIKINQNNKE